MTFDVTDQSTWPELLTAAEVAAVFRSTALNQSRSGRDIMARHQMPTVDGHRGGKLAPKWAVVEVIGGPLQARPVCCPTCGGDLDATGSCPQHPRLRRLEGVA